MELELRFLHLHIPDMVHLCNSGYLPPLRSSEEAPAPDSYYGPP